MYKLASFCSVMLMIFGMVFADHWGDFKDNGCVDLGGGAKARSYSAVLWDIPFGYSWEDACAKKDATVNGYYFEHPTACVKTSVASALGAVATAIGAAGLVYPPAGVFGTILGSTAVALDLGGAGGLNMWGVFYVQDGTC